MAQATLSQVLHVMDTLDQEGLRTVERVAQEKLKKSQDTVGYSPEEGGALQGLLQASLLTEIKPKRINRIVERPSIVIKGTPLSETIIEERR